jgi:hypothetical protein
MPERDGRHPGWAGIVFCARLVHGLRENRSLKRQSRLFAVSA